MLSGPYAVTFAGQQYQKNQWSQAEIDTNKVVDHDVVVSHKFMNGKSMI